MKKTTPKTSGPSSKPFKIDVLKVKPNTERDKKEECAGCGLMFGSRNDPKCVEDWIKCGLVSVRRGSTKAVVKKTGYFMMMTSIVKIVYRPILGLVSFKVGLFH